MAVCSFGHCEAALSLQAAYSDYQIGGFENFHQLVEDTLIFLRPGRKDFFTNSFRFFNSLKTNCWLGLFFFLTKLFCPPLLLKKKAAGPKKERGIKPILGDIPAF